MSTPLVSISPRSVIDGRYEIVRLIGKGGMGAVYEAVKVDSRRRVAVKVLKEKCCRVPEVMERFERESRLAASIGHPNICEVIDFGSCENGAPYLVMPLLSGMPLGRLLKTRQTPMAETRLSAIIEDALLGLAAAHEAGVIHRDLKPDNIYVISGRRGRDTVKLLDFGVSKVVSSAVRGGVIETKEGAIIGTPAYMAPEQAKGARLVDHRIDIYAMGVILYEIMTGTLPHKGETEQELILKIIAGPFLSPRRINPDISSGMERVILKAMAKAPASRFASALEMRDALKRNSGFSSIPPGRATSAPTAVTYLDTPFLTNEVEFPTTATDTEIPRDLIAEVDSRKRLIRLFLFFIVLAIVSAGILLLMMPDAL